MAAPVAAIHVSVAVSKDVDGRDTPGHDVEKRQSPTAKLTGRPWGTPGMTG